MFIINTMVNSGNQLVSASHSLLQDSIYIYIYIYTYITPGALQPCFPLAIYVQETTWKQARAPKDVLGAQVRFNTTITLMWSLVELVGEIMLNLQNHN